MKKEKLPCTSARNIPILSYLKKEGFSPVKENTREAWFISPFRSEKEASFKVSKLLNRWFDHGSGQGGNIIDLVTNLRRYNVQQALAHLTGKLPSFSFQQQKYFAVSEKADEISIEKVVPLQHPALISYLKSRCIHPGMVHTFVKQVHYTVKGRSFFALGLPNRLGGWELRNAYFKSCCTPKSYSLFSSSQEMLCICEGMFDFFSLLCLYPALPMKANFLVLNSVAFANRIRETAARYSKVCLYLDNDLSGKTATGQLLASIPNGVDMAALYDGHLDLNDYLVALRKQE